jgi:hypothetical protein
MPTNNRYRPSFTIEQIDWLILAAQNRCATSPDDATGYKCIASLAATKARATSGSKPDYVAKPRASIEEQLGMPLPNKEVIWEASYNTLISTKSTLTPQEYCNAAEHMYLNGLGGDKFAAKFEACQGQQDIIKLMVHFHQFHHSVYDELNGDES